MAGWLITYFSVMWKAQNTFILALHRLNPASVCGLIQLFRRSPGIHSHTWKLTFSIVINLSRVTAVVANSPVPLTCSPSTQRQTNVSSSAIQLCRFDLITALPPLSSSSPSSHTCVQRVLSAHHHTGNTQVSICVYIACMTH